MLVSHKSPVFLTVPSLLDQGGVASFFNSILPHIPEGKVTLLEIGGTKNTGGVLHPLVDQVRFRRAVQKEQPALIHLNPSLGLKSFIRDGFFAWQAKQMGYPLLVFWRGWDKTFEDKVTRFFLGFFRKTFGRADGFIVLASEFERTLREWGVNSPIYRETTSVADNLLSGVDVVEKWRSFNEASVVKILFLARLERAKGVYETLQAFKILVDKNIPVKLTIAGNGKILHKLIEYSRTLKLTSQQVCFTGDIRGKEKVRALTEHHVYCLPSYSEGLPNSVLEAMAFGMPVLTRPVGGLADIFEDGKMGRLVQGKNPEEIAGCLEDIILNRDRMVEMGRYNADYARKNFLARVVAKRLMIIYDALKVKVNQ